MKKQNGFIATSLLYTFFLAFVTLFIGVVAIYLQNRVYLVKLEDSSKNLIYIREMKEKLESGSVKVKIITDNATTNHESITLISDEDNIFQYDSKKCDFTKCETIFYYSTDSRYILEGCESTC